MHENWDFYPCRVEGEPASIMVNLGLHAEAPLAELTDVTRLRLSMQQPRDDGLSSQEEFDRLVEVGDALSAALEESERAAEYAGRCTAGGFRDFYVYTENGLGAEALLSTVMVPFPEYDFSLTSRPDPDWRLYLEFLYPTPRSMQLINNRRVIEALEEGGDSPEIPREVRHWASFENAGDRAQFREALVERGFQVINEVETAESPRPQTLIFERVDRTEFFAINDLIFELYDLAESHGGRYDGWETHVKSE